VSLFSGQGPVSWANRDASGDPEFFNWFGNAPEFTMGLAADTLTHKESYTGNRTTDARIITELTASLSITVDDFKEANMELATFGTGSQVASDTVTGEDVWDSAPVVGERYSLKTTGRVSAVTLNSAGSPISTSLYTVDASGIIVFSSVSGVTGPITADYTKAAARLVGVFKTSAPEIAVRLVGLNTATESGTVSGDFERSIVDIYKARMDPTENLNFINDEFGTLVLNGSALVDTLKAAASAGGQFARIIYLDPPSQTVASASVSPSASGSPSVSPSASVSPS